MNASSVATNQETTGITQRRTAVHKLRWLSPGNSRRIQWCGNVQVRCPTRAHGMFSIWCLFETKAWFYSREPPAKRRRRYMDSTYAMIRPMPKTAIRVDVQSAFYLSKVCTPRQGIHIFTQNDKSVCVTRASSSGLYQETASVQPDTMVVMWSPLI